MTGPCLTSYMDLQTDLSYLKWCSDAIILTCVTQAPRVTQASGTLSFSITRCQLLSTIGNMGFEDFVWLDSRGHARLHLSDPRALWALKTQVGLICFYIMPDVTGMNCEDGITLDC